MRRWREWSEFDRFGFLVTVATAAIFLALILLVTCNGDR